MHQFLSLSFKPLFLHKEWIHTSLSIPWSRSCHLASSLLRAELCTCTSIYSNSCLCFFIKRGCVSLNIPGLAFQLQAFISSSSGEVKHFIFQVLLREVIFVWLHILAVHPKKLTGCFIKCSRLKHVVGSTAFVVFQANHLLCNCKVPISKI